MRNSKVIYLVLLSFITWSILYLNILMILIVATSLSNQSFKVQATNTGIMVLGFYLLNAIYYKHFFKCCYAKIKIPLPINT